MPTFPGTRKKARRCAQEKRAARARSQVARRRRRGEISAARGGERKGLVVATSQQKAPRQFRGPLGRNSERWPPRPPRVCAFHLQCYIIFGPPRERSASEPAEHLDGGLSLPPPPRLDYIHIGTPTWRGSFASVPLALLSFFISRQLMVGPTFCLALRATRARSRMRVSSPFTRCAEVLWLLTWLVRRTIYAQVAGVRAAPQGSLFCW